MAEVTHGVRAILLRPAIYELWSSLVGGARARTILITDHVRPGAGERILDLWSWSGESLTAMPAGVAYFGVDISEAYIARARDHFGDRAEFVRGDASRFDPAGRQFDLALAVGVLHHLDDDQARGLFSTAANALTPEGRLVTIDPYVFRRSEPPCARGHLARPRSACTPPQ